MIHACGSFLSFFLFLTRQDARLSSISWVQAWTYLVGPRFKASSTWDETRRDMLFVTSQCILQMRAHKTRKGGRETSTNLSRWTCLIISLQDWVVLPHSVKGMISSVEESKQPTRGREINSCKKKRREEKRLSGGNNHMKQFTDKLSSIMSGIL